LCGAGLRRVSSALDQARFAFDKRPADRSALLIVEFKLQATVPGPWRSRHAVGKNS
jgi:hypothetical protein